MLSLRGVSSGYSIIQVVHEVSLDVELSQNLALIGPNGAGKTTLLETIAGFVTIKAGSIGFDGEDITRLAPDARARRGISLVTERRNLFPDLTAGENLHLGRCCAPAAERWQKAAITRARDKVMALFPKLEQIINRPVGVMSGGEQQMVAVGRALMAEPKLLLLDEPSQGLAPKLVQAMYQAIKRISAETTVILVEQDLALARSVTSNIYLLLNGRLEKPNADDIADVNLLSRRVFGRSVSETVH